MTEPAPKVNDPAQKPAKSAETDASHDMLADADHMGVPLVFDEDGNVVSGTDPRRG